MRAPRSVITDTSTAVRRAMAREPVLAALDSLGVSVGTIAARLGYETSAPVSLWRNGTNPIPQRHRAALNAMLREAIDATRGLVAQAEQLGAGVPSEVAELRRRAERAEVVLKEAK